MTLVDHPLDQVMGAVRPLGREDASERVEPLARFLGIVVGLAVERHGLNLLGGSFYSIRSRSGRPASLDWSVAHRSAVKRPAARRPGRAAAGARAHFASGTPRAGAPPAPRRSGPAWQAGRRARWAGGGSSSARSEEHTSELQSQFHLVCRLL